MIVTTKGPCFLFLLSTSRKKICLTCASNSQTYDPFRTTAQLETYIKTIVAPNISDDQLQGIVTLYPEDPTQGKLHSCSLSVRIVIIIS